MTTGNAVALDQKEDRNGTLGRIHLHVCKNVTSLDISMRTFYKNVHAEDRNGAKSGVLLCVLSL